MMDDTNNPINETQVKINHILARGIYILAGIDPSTQPPDIRVHFVGIPAAPAMRVVLGLAVQSANTDPQIKSDFIKFAAQLDERAFLELAMEISNRLQMEEEIARGLKN